MLGNLLKYEYKKIYKVLVVFYILSLFFAILTRLFFTIDNSYMMNIIGRICSGITISMIVNIIINNIMRLWGCFKLSFYSDEAYLTHTLPVSKNVLYNSKVISSIFTFFTSMLVIVITLFIAYYSKENMLVLKELLFPIANLYESSILGLILAVIFILFLELLNIIFTGFTGLIIGHKFNHHKAAYSILFGFLIYMASQVIVLTMLFIAGIFNENIMNLFVTTNPVSIDTIKLIFSFSLVVYIIILIVNHFINKKLFKDGVNLD